MEMEEITNEKKSRRSIKDLESGRAHSKDSDSAGEGDEGGDRTGDGKVVKKETVVLRLGEGKLTGPMRFITCYATAFTFLVMTGFIVWLLMISPPFNVTPQIRPEDMAAHLPPHLTAKTTTTTNTTTTTILPPETEEPEFSSDFHQG